MDIAALTSGSNSTDSGIAQKSLSENFDQFLTMLTVQLQNQDPLSPMDSTEFTNQLVSFSSLEQEIKSNSNLEQVIALQQSAEATAALSYLGTEVEAQSSAVYLQDGNTEFSYNMPAGAHTATVTVFDADGNIIKSLPAVTDPGHQSGSWDGLNEQDVLQADGVYSILVSALDQDGAPLDPIPVFLKGTATGVTQENGQTFVQVGPIDILLSSIFGVSTPDETSVE
tara:strand:+ start:10747 stop:11424 length:678 start_codon:yes stop_codon:yes gene_type:complete